MISYFTDLALTDIYTLSLHDALPISDLAALAGCGYELRLLVHLIAPQHIDCDLLDTAGGIGAGQSFVFKFRGIRSFAEDRKSTRLNSSHVSISYAVFCLKKKRFMRLH